MSVYCPCRNCQERKEGCHSSCQLYLHYVDEKTKERIHLKNHTGALSYQLSKLGATCSSSSKKVRLRKGRFYS